MNQQTESRILFVTGGSRSGKSRYAETRAMTISGQRTYVATCPVIDDEMEERIERHRKQRAGQDWATIEEPLDLVQALNDSRDSAVVLVDCLTLWINNLLYEAQKNQQMINEQDVHSLCEQVIKASRKGKRTIVFVTNELGMGLVPADSNSRLFRDLAGVCNQAIAAAADEVVFMVSGLPLFFKGKESQ